MSEGILNKILCTNRKIFRNPIKIGEAEFPRKVLVQKFLRKLWLKNFNAFLRTILFNNFPEIFGNNLFFLKASTSLYLAFYAAFEIK